MINGLDLFSGIGGLSIALNEWVRPVAYCEIDPYCRGVLLSRMSSGLLSKSPIWDDVVSLSSKIMVGITDIIYGGFPCQDISVAGRGKGLEGKRSGLFFEIVRLAKEIKPKFIFLENVPAITSRGGVQVVEAITEMGYDCRWCVISAASVGAMHKRERWFLLAHTACENRSRLPERKAAERSKLGQSICDVSRETSSNPSSLRCDQGSGQGIHSERPSSQHEKYGNNSSQVFDYWQNTEPPVLGIPNGIPCRVDRVRALGNAVVPQQAKEAFKILMGIK